MFNLGWGEIVVIGIVALIAIGPKELPTVLRTLAQWMGKIRRMASEFQGQFQEALREAELTDLKKHADDITSDITNFDPLADTKKEMERAFDMPDPMAPATAAASAETETASAAPAPTAESATPLAEVSPLPEINIPFPDSPAPLTERDFAPAEPPPAKETKKQAGGSA
jgi:sec-independent protein translocase protein TatB